MGIDSFSYKKIILTIIISLLLLTIVPQTTSGTQNHTVFGYITYSNGQKITDSLSITITNTDTGKVTILPSDNEGFYTSDIEGDVGDVIWINTSFNGTKGSNSIILTNSTSQQCNIIMPMDTLPPEAFFSFSPGNLAVNQNIMFFDESYGEDELISWLWDFGDGNSSISQNPTHIYEKPGKYSVQLIVVDNGGKSDSFSKNITVIDIGFLPNANFSYTPLSPKNNEEIYFSDNSYDLDGDITGWLWDFGDDGVSNQQNPVKQYELPGKYVVKLEVIDDKNLIDSISKVIIIKNRDAGSFYLEADFTYELERSKEKTRVYFFDNSRTDEYSIVSWFWDFGDGCNSSEQNPFHDYFEPGKYVVKFFIKNEVGEENELQSTIKIPHYNEEKIIITSQNDENIETFMIWKGLVVNASVLVQKMNLNYGESISIFDIETGTWKKYTNILTSRTNDFIVNPWTIIKLECNSTKEFWMMNLNQSSYTQERIDLKNTYQQSDKSGNPGYNYFIWMKALSIKASQLANYICLESSWIVSKYSEDEDRWISYVHGIGLEDTLLDFVIEKDDLVCIRVSRDANLVFNDLRIEYL